MVKDRLRSFYRIRKDWKAIPPQKEWTVLAVYLGLPLYVKRFETWKEATEWTSIQASSEKHRLTNRTN